MAAIAAAVDSKKLEEEQSLSEALGVKRVAAHESKVFGKYSSSGGGVRGSSMAVNGNDSNSASLLSGSNSENSKRGEWKSYSSSKGSLTPLLLSLPLLRLEEDTASVSRRDSLVTTRETGCGGLVPIMLLYSLLLFTPLLLFDGIVPVAATNPLQSLESTWAVFIEF